MGTLRHRKVFIPTTPNPTTGYFQLVPVDRCKILDMSTEEAFRLIMSAGFLAPPVLQTSGRKAPGHRAPETGPATLS